MYNPELQARRGERRVTSIRLLWNMRVVGFTLVSNAIRLDFPIVAAIRSILPLCDEVIVNVGPSEDATLDLVRGLADPRVRVIEGAWDPGLGGRVLAAETQRALDLVRGDWAVYVQADEVLHDSAVPVLADAMRDTVGDSRVEGLLVDYVHFYGNVSWVATNRTWYRREVRVVRPGGTVRSHEEAQGFRVGAGHRRIAARRTGALMFHYGWARSQAALREKREIDHLMYHARDGRSIRAPIPEQIPWQVGLRPFAGTHPSAAVDWIASHYAEPEMRFGRRRWTPEMLRIGASLLVERATGWRPFEYRNYTEV